jgi:chorismate synthase
MSHNSFGHLFRVTTWGESHGPAIGCVVDGCPPGIALTEEDIQPWLDQRRPGQSQFVTQRQEPDKVRILSGVFEDERTGGPVTTGTPISLMIENTDQRSKDYSEIAQPSGRAMPTGLFRQIRRARLSRRRPVVRARDGDAGGGRRGRAQGAGRGDDPRRAGADRAARGSIAPLGLERRPGRTRSGARRRHGPPSGKSTWMKIRKAGSSCGAVDRGRGQGRAAGAGARRSTASSTPNSPPLMSINAVKGVEIGAGFASRRLSGEDNADEMRMGNDGIACSCRTMPAACWAASRPASRWSRASRSSRPPRSSRRAQTVDKAGRRSSCAPRAGTIPASASARCRWARRCWPACWRMRFCATAARRAAGRMRRGLAGGGRSGWRGRGLLSALRLIVVPASRFRKSKRRADPQTPMRRFHFDGRVAGIPRRRAVRKPEK